MSSEELKTKLKKLIEDSKAKAAETVRLEDAITRQGQADLDLADASLKVLKHSPPPDFDYGSALKVWQFKSEQQDAINAALQPLVTVLVANMSSTASTAFVMTPLASPQVLASYQPPDTQDAARIDSEQLGYVLDKVADKESVVTLLRKFQLDTAASDKHSPLMLFETAWAAYEKPVTFNSPANTSLLPMRECIKEAIEALLRRRPEQEATGNERAKIISIGSQLAYDGIPQKAIESLADRWHLKDRVGLVDELSGSKDKVLSREEWLTTLRRATLFLRELIQSLDPAKLK